MPPVLRGQKQRRFQLPDDPRDMKVGYYASAALHVIVAAVAIFGLPHIMPDPPQIEDAVVVELAPVAEKTNAPPKQQAQPKAEEKPAEPEKQDTPPVPEPKPEPPQPKPEPPPPPKPPEPPPPPKPPEPTPPPPPKPEPAPTPTPKPEPPKPPPPKPEPPKEQPKKKDDFDSMMSSALNTLQKPKPQSNPSPAPQPQNTPAASKVTSNSSSWDPTQPISMADKDFIAAQFRKCWSFDPGAKDPASLIVRIHVLMNSDGSVSKAEIVDDPRYYSDSYFRSAADSARRAVYSCSPIKIPPGKADAFRDLVLNFDPRDSIR